MSLMRIHALATAMTADVAQAEAGTKRYGVLVDDLRDILDYAKASAARDMQKAETTLALPANLDDVCARACTTWSAQSQEDVAIGEIGELLTLFGRRAAKRDTHEEWVDEIADVIIMMHQLAFLRGRSDVSARIAEKVQRITARLDRLETRQKD